ncbi:hypothetical protein DBR32_07905 [Taibaiella sp. KBW10]|uniref:SbcC/MukB-like Walker B domain-containing protein n=1 Tax=Taibaiella sp. KBW10 TaxID=2153357 RepID=UPI000F5A2C16|nr:SMC family ATPase [Taibaiella sp. KBW10]RQO30649.1 hypothetical protein DBR32_07905 [Taibaiella sp. KBW10]
MLPLRLSIEGFYSYQEKQTIDFEALTEAGLFGIFGAVGSGKSSILEAISFVLYGATERLDSGDRRAYNMLNLKSDKALIDFEFKITAKDLYRFTATWKRRKKDYAATSTIERTAYKWEEGTWVPLPTANAEPILGLKYDNFKRTIIIPQGKFKEFLELTKTPRMEMLKEIFNLYQYDFALPVKQLSNRNNEAMQRNEGILSQYTSYTREVLETKEIALASLSVLVRESTARATEAQKTFDQLHALKSLQEQLEQARQDVDSLAMKQASFAQRNHFLNQYHTALIQFKGLLNQNTHYQTQLAQLEQQLQQYTRERQQATLALTQQEAQLADITKEYHKIETSRVQLQLLKNLMALALYEQEYAAVQQRVANGQQFVDKEQTLYAQLSQDILQTEQQVAQLKSAKPDTEILLAATEWYRRQEQLETEYKNTLSLLAQNRIAQKNIEAHLSESGIPLKGWEDFFEAGVQPLKQAIAADTKRVTALQLQVELSKYRQEIVDGKPCPLCGSEVHHELAHAVEVQPSLEEAQSALSQSEQALADWNARQFEVAHIQGQRTQYAAEEMNYAQLQTTQEAQLAEQDRLFIWPHLFDKTDTRKLEQYKLNILQTETDMEQAASVLQEQRAQQQLCLEKINTFRQKVLDLSGTAQQKKGAIDILLKQMEGMDSSAWKGQSQSQLEELSVGIVSHIAATEKQYEQINHAVQEQKERLARLDTASTLQQQQVAKVKEQLGLIEKELKEKLDHSAFETLEEIQQLLQADINPEQEKAAIDTFYKNLHSAELTLQNLKTAIGAAVFDAAAYQQAVEVLKSAVETIQQQSNEHLLLTNEISELKNKINEKETYEKTREALLLRAADLKVMTNMFQANGFVEYISEVYLQNLCSVANERFHRLTGNQLSLIYEAEKGFEIMDYLNGGKARSVKTLSGGQSFQASLCLALALAESIHSLNRFEKNFFFIDEGFGTLDKEAIETVFQTLEQLYKEHRVVGIISHVEELQERIPRYLKVIKDPERGSLVTLD